MGSPLLKVNYSMRVISVFVLPLSIYGLNTFGEAYRLPFFVSLQSCPSQSAYGPEIHQRLDQISPKEIQAGTSHTPPSFVLSLVQEASYEPYPLSPGGGNVWRFAVVATHAYNSAIVMRNDEGDLNG
jgi:hypothetical protein